MRALPGLLLGATLVLEASHTRTTTSPVPRPSAAGRGGGFEVLHGDPGTSDRQLSEPEATSWKRFATHMASAAAASTLASSSASSRSGSTAVPCIPHLAGVSPAGATSISSTPTSSVAATVPPDAGAVEAAATAGPAALLASAAAIAASAAGWGKLGGGGAWDESVGGAFGSSGRCRFSAGRITNTLVGST